LFKDGFTSTNAKAAVRQRAAKIEDKLNLQKSRKVVTNVLVSYQYNMHWTKPPRFLHWKTFSKMP